LLDKEPISKFCAELGLELEVFYRVSRRIRVERDRKSWRRREDRIQGDRTLAIHSFSQLLILTNAWNGEYPNPETWNTALADAQRTAEAEVDRMCAIAKEREEGGLTSQTEAARLRLTGELGRYLICFGDSGDLNHTLQEQATRDTATAARLRECLQRLGGYPAWAPELVRELKEFGKDLTENKRRGRLLGRELEASLQDPRWTAASVLVEHAAV